MGISERPLENLRPLPLSVSLPLQYLTAVIPLYRYILTVITVTYRPHQYGRLSAAPFNGRSLVGMHMNVFTLHTFIPNIPAAVVIPLVLLRDVLESDPFKRAAATGIAAIASGGYRRT